MENIIFKNITENEISKYIEKNPKKNLLIKEENDLNSSDKLNDKYLRIIYLNDCYIFHPLYIDLIKIIFECICIEHNEIFYNNDSKNISNFDELNKSLSKDSRCVKNGCKQKFKKYEIINKEGIRSFTNGGKNYDAKKVHEIFCKVFNKNNNLFFNPKDLILNYIPLIPNYIRPSTQRDETNYEDILTSYYKKIINISNNKSRLKDNIYDIYEKILYKQTIDKQKSILKRISGKKGIFRNNILGKRTKLCGRSVITPEIKLKLDEISIPLKISNKLKIREDDTVLFIRHPTLQKMSIMAMKIKIHDNSYTIKMNTSLCTAYNADFDGDEMNIFYLKDYKSIAEAKYINSSIKCIISPQNYDPIIYLSQDYIFGMYMLSKNNMKISKNIYYNCLTIYNNFSNKFKKNINSKNFNGRLLLSLFFPKNLNYKNNEIEIKNGFLLNGCIDKKNILEIIKKLSYTENDVTVSDFIYNSQLIIDEWLKMEGISIGYEDCYSKNVEINKKNNNLDINKFNIINRNIIKNIINNNMIKNIISSGSKGSIVNLYNIISCVGQQYIKNKKPEKIILDNNFSGFCYNNYIIGLNEFEYYYHSQSAREGIINTNITTPVVGYLNRNLVKTLENVIIQYNNYLICNNYIIN